MKINVSDFFHSNTALSKELIVLLLFSHQKFAKIRGSISVRRSG